MLDFQVYPTRTLTAPTSTVVVIPSSQVKLYSVLANAQIFNLKFCDAGWPARLPVHPSHAAPRAFSVATIKVMRHGIRRGRYTLRKDSGGWIPTDILAGYFENAQPHDQGPITEYLAAHQHQFSNVDEAKIAAYIAYWAGDRGNRTSFLMAVRTTMVEGREVRDYIKPVAVRTCSGQSLENQMYLRMSRFNLKLTQELVLKVPGLFHVTTSEAWPLILQDGLKAGIDLPSSGNKGGRADIHLLTVPPHPNDLFDNRRLRRKCGQEVMAMPL